MLSPTRNPANGPSAIAPAPLNPSFLDREDLHLAERVERALRATGYSPLRDIQVTVHARVVMLAGRVPSYHLKQVAQTIALAVVGAHRVSNDLHVCRPA